MAQNNIMQGTEAVNGNFTALTLHFQDEELLKELITKSNVRNNFFVFSLIVKGRSSLKINLKEFEICKNDLLIIPPDATKEHVSISENTTVKVIAYTSAFLIPLTLPDNFWEMTDYFSSKNIPVWSLKEKEVEKLTGLISQMENFHNNKENHPYAQQILRYFFMIFILELAALAPAYLQPGNHRYTRKEALTIQFYSLAKKQFKTERSVQHYASLLFITPRYLTETIKEVSGKNAGEVIDTFTAQEAKILLTNTTKTISEIAAELNFSDQSAFGKFFKRLVGISPGEYRASAY